MARRLFAPLSPILSLAAICCGAAISFSVGAQEPPSQETWPFKYSPNQNATCLLDLRYLNEKTAGESGFVKLSPDGRSFLLGSGKPLRLWSTVTDAYRLKPEEMATHARFLAKLGVNMVRLHTQIAPPGPGGALTDVNEKEIDGIWRCVAAMKKEGIYCTISPYWATAKDASKWGIEGYNGTTDLWGLLFFNPQMQQGYRAWVKALYTRANPYTGIPLASDPAVAIIQVQNEDGMFFWTMQGLHPEQKAALGRKFFGWLKARYGSADGIKAAWPGAANEKDDLEHGVAAILDTWFLTQKHQGGMAKRTSDQTEFFADVQRRFYADIASYYRKDLGCKQLINASNWITADPIHLNDVERYTNTACDVLAVNRYTGGVHTGENNGWRIDPGHHFTNSSCLLDPRSMPFNLKQVVGHPMIITESNWVSPEGYQSEATFLTSVYQSLTGVNSLYWFATGSTPQYDPDPYFNFLTIQGCHPMAKWTCSTPMVMGTFPAAALLYRLGYVKQGSPVVHEERPLKDLWERTDPVLAEDRTFDPNRNTGNTGGKSELKKGADPLAFLAGPVEVRYGGNAEATQIADLSKLIDAGKSTVTSITGEVKLDYANGLCTVNAPAAQGACGFLAKKGTFALKDVTIESTDAYASLLCVAMDQKPLATSGKMLIQIATRARPTGFKARETDFKGDDGKQSFHGYEVMNTGTMPWQISTCHTTLTLRNAGVTHARILDAAGYPAGEAKTEKIGGTLKITLPSNALYVVVE